jgi:Dolichyl-phosphate-mannose-protein mannosyltransferase
MAQVVKARSSTPANQDWPVAGLVIAACLAPSVIWILADSRVWWWDQSIYGEATLRVWQTGLDSWAQAVINAPGGQLPSISSPDGQQVTDTLHGQPPVLVWLGQFFIPLRHVTGSFESALLLVNICAAAGTLVLIYDIARRLGARGAGALAGVMTCAGSGMFIALTHQYFVEIMQCLAAAATMAVALDSEKRSYARTAAMIIGVIGFGFLSKASSMTFLLPMLCYVAVAAWASRRKIRPAARFGDAILFAGAVCAAGLVATWYWLHWQAVVQHVADATSSDFALHWGSPVNLPVKLRNWIGAFARSLSSFVIVLAAMAAVVSAAFVVAIRRVAERRLGEWVKASVADGTLFALAVAGTGAGIIFAYSLQINDDVRFIVLLTPMAGVLVAWGLATIGNRIVSQLLLGVLALNAAVSHAYSFGFDPLHIVPAGDLAPIGQNQTPADAAGLDRAFRTTCHADDAGQPHLIVVTYATLNVNILNFYAAKESYASGFRCFYTTYNVFDPDAGHALDAIDAIAPVYIVTVAPEQQPAPDGLHPDYVNGASRPVTEHLAADPRYRLESSPGSYIQFYRRVGGPDR